MDDYVSSLYDYEIENRLLTIPVNSNLLDNWYFANPVNQRAKTTYTGNGYTVDRWRILHSSATVNVEDNGISITDITGGYITFGQLIENPGELAGKTLTISALINSISGTWRFMVRWGVDGSKRLFFDFTANGLQSFTFTLPNDGIEFLDVNVSERVSNTQINLLAVKLELGTQQTIAHQEGNVWVLNEIPNYGEQLSRCQRYCYVIDYTGRNIIGAYCVSTYNDIVNAYIPVPTPMRTNPTLSNTAGNLWKLSGGGEVVYPSAATLWFASSKGIIGIKFSVSNVPLNQVYVVSYNNAEKLVISCDL